MVVASLIINGIVNAFSSFFAITLNILTILALRKTPSLPKPMKVLLLSLAVSYLGVGLLVQPLFIALISMDMQQESSNSVLRIFHITGTFFSYASFFGITALSLDRFLAIHLHLRYQELVTHKRVAALVIAIWVTSTILALLVFFFQNITFIVLAVIVVFCFLSTTFYYINIFLAVQRHKNKMRSTKADAHQATADSENGKEHFTRLRKSAVGTFYVYLVFLACYTPDFCIIVADVINSGQRSTFVKHLAFFTLSLVFVNSSFNPLIYCWKMRNIRHAITVIIRNIRQCNK